MYFVQNPLKITNDGDYGLYAACFFSKTETKKYISTLAKKESRKKWEYNIVKIEPNTADSYMLKQFAKVLNKMSETRFTLTHDGA